MDFAIPKEWENFLSNELKKEYVLSLKLRLKKEKALHKKIFPSEREIFKAFELTSPEKTKVIIIGQDPYHNPNQANGLCFSVKKNQALPPSLKNIYKEIEEDMNNRNSISKRNKSDKDEITLSNNGDASKTRKKREELSISACKCIKKENIKIVVSFN